MARGGGNEGGVGGGECAVRHFSTLSKRVEFSTRGEPGKVQVERSGMVDEVGGKGEGDRGLAGIA